MTAGDDETRQRKRKPAVSWDEELRALAQQFDSKLELDKTRLVFGWTEEGKRWTALADERDRILVLKNGLGWLSRDAAALVDRRVSAASEVIDARLNARAGQAALRLSQAEHVMQRAWWSRLWNTWRSPNPARVPLWIVISVVLLAALGGTVYVIFTYDLFPHGDRVGLPEALFGAVFWGFGGALVNGVRTVHHEVQRQEFEVERIVWYFLSPAIGFAFGAIAFLLFITGLLSTGQDVGGRASQEGGEVSNTLVDPTPILLVAVLAGFAQNAFIAALQQIIKERFRGAPEEEA
jgi:hypothetical protein